MNPQVSSVERQAVVSTVDSRSVTLSQGRIEDLAEVWRYICNIDFEPLKFKIVDPVYEGGQEWTKDRANFVELQYKRWLFLRRKYLGESMPPSVEIDVFWHFHILDTQAYFRDCSFVYGGYFHHFPYLGMRGKSDERKLEDGFAHTHERWQQEFGEPLYDFE